MVRSLGKIYGGVEKQFFNVRGKKTSSFINLWICRPRGKCVCVRKFGEKLNESGKGVFQFISVFLLKSFSFSFLAS